MPAERPPEFSLKTRVSILAGCVLVGLAIYWWSSSADQQPTPRPSAPTVTGGNASVAKVPNPAPSEQSSVVGPISQPAADVPSSVMPVAPAVVPSAPVDLDAPLEVRPEPRAATIAGDLENVTETIRTYRTQLGENPVGTNAEITSQLLGQNLKQVRLNLPQGHAVNEAGELTDRWGSPYFFHQVSKDKMEVRSAGPDRQMWTTDDRQM